MMSWPRPLASAAMVVALAIDVVRTRAETPGMSKSRTGLTKQYS